MFIMYKQFPEALGGRFPAEDFSGALVEHFLISGELLVRDFGEVGGQLASDPHTTGHTGPYPAVPI